MHMTLESPRHTASPPFASDKMDISTITAAPTLPSLKTADSLHINLSIRPVALPQTPPDSLSGSPRPKFEGLSPLNFSPLSEAATPRTASTSPGGLPSINEFDEGVRAIARSREPACLQTPSSPISGFGARGGIYPPMQAQYQGFRPAYDSYQSAPFVGGDAPPSPGPETDDRHINQKYSTEEGDFIIYAWLDKKMKWVAVQKEFAERFGAMPKRSVQGLQAWYYRMNQRVPVWDADGWLKFDNDDDFEPRQVSIKCRDGDGQSRGSEPLGLAERYPERAIHYSWVDPDMKLRARDWAAKRTMQYRERKERRRRKEQMRM